MADDDFRTNWVWVPDRDELFVRGAITDYLDNNRVRVSVKHGAQEVVQEVDQLRIESCNPAKFNKCEDMAELTHLNEPLVIYNLFLRYNDDLIYTYLGLFLVAINPYKRLPIYDAAVLRKFHGAAHDERLPPHIFAIAENTHRNLVAHAKDQLILVTGESGAGKTENTKKIIQYLSQISAGAGAGDIHDKILQANPLLESFGNAKTIKNNNSSRFGKFIKIYFDRTGLICGATIDYYLLEKPRVSHQLHDERNYHVFYQFLMGCDDKTLKEKYHLAPDFQKYKYLSSSTGSIPNVDDGRDFAHLNDAFRIMGFSTDEVDNILLTLAVILHLGNLDFQSWKSEQAHFAADANVPFIAQLLGISESDLSKNLLRPKVKAGREFVERLRKAAEVKSNIDAFAKHLYERIFQYIIARINKLLVGDGDFSNDHFIGVLDIAGFEIFESNSFEQLCINYTNEKLQQFFNHHLFILEQSEYLREDIQWEYIDFGLDLQPTIDLIETKKPMGVLEILNEQCMIPKASEETFINKLLETWGGGQSTKFRPNKVRSGFIIDHYAGPVEYNIEDWLLKNTDPASEHILQLLPGLSNSFIRELFTEDTKKKTRHKTVTQRHKEQLAFLMDQLSSTEPHFVRCILPNLTKKPNKFDKELVLHQLRCNGVLEGIRIARAGYPNKMTFDEFFARYAILNSTDVFTKNAKTNSELILKHIKLDPESYKIGITKLFFKNGILGQMEELRDMSLRKIITSFQSIIRGQLARKKIKKQILIIQASQVVARNFNKLDSMVNGDDSPWFKLFISLKPLLEETVKIMDSNELNEGMKKVSSKLKETETAKVALESENQSLKERLTNLEDDIMKANSALAEKEKTFKALQKEENTRSTKVAESTKQLAELKTANDKLRKERDELSAKLKESQQKLDKVQEELKLITAEYDALKKLSEMSKKEIDRLTKIEEQHKESLAKISGLEEDAKSHQSTAAALEKAELTIQTLRDASQVHETTSKELVETKTNMKELELKIDTHEKALLLKSEALEKVQKEADDAKEKLVLLKSELETLKSTHSESDQSHQKAIDLLKADYELKIEELETAKKALEKDVKELKDARDELQVKIGEHQETHRELKLNVKELEKAKSEHETRARLLQDDFEKQQRSLELESKREIDRLTSSMEKTKQKMEYLEEQLQEKRSEVADANKRCRDAERMLDKTNAELEKSKLLEAKLAEKHELNEQLVKEVELTKLSLARHIKENKSVLESFENMKHETQYLTRAKAEYSEQIMKLKDQVQDLEVRLQDKENVPPPLAKVDPNIMTEFANIKLKLNELSAIIRNERFENQKLSEEVRMLRKKLDDNFESPLKRSEARRSLAMGDDIRLSQINDTRYAEEVRTLRIRLQQEEANVIRAENYAIDLQKKLNKFQMTRGVNSFTDYETKYKKLQSRIEELEKKIESVLSGSQGSSPEPNNDVMSRSSSLGTIASSSSGDFAKIYKDINQTLKATREELNKSKSEILRLKSLLRDSEDELYEIKKSNVKTSIKDYEEELARVRVNNSTLTKKQEELQQSLLKYKKRSDEYYEKLELAESAVTISKRHEQQARKELEEKSTELMLMKEEIRALEKLIKKLRQERNELDVKCKQLQNKEQQLRGQMTTLLERIQYLNDTYGDKKNTIEEHKEEIRGLHQDLKFKLEKETEIIKENKKLKIENEELTRVREEVLAENSEVNEENEKLAAHNDELKNEVEHLKNEKAVHERKLDQNGKQIESLKELIADNGRQMEALNAFNRELEQTKETLENNVSNLQDKLNEALMNLDLLREHSESLEKEKSLARQELDLIRGRWDNSDGQYKQARTENLVIVQENESLKTVNAELRKKVGVLEEKLYLNEQLKYLENNITKLNSELDGLKHQLYDSDAREQKLKKQVATLEYDNEGKSMQMKRYNDENFNFQNMLGQYRGKVEFLHQENSEKDLKIKAQERELLELREKLLVIERERLTSY